MYFIWIMLVRMMAVLHISLLRIELKKVMQYFREGNYNWMI